MASELQITVDAADPGALARFWALVLGYEPEAPPQGYASWEDFLESAGVPRDRWNSASAISDPGGRGPRLFFQRVPEPKTAKNRMHIDVRAAPGLTGDERMDVLERRCAELVDAGARRVRRFEPDGGLSAGFLVMADPEGNEFCLD